MTQGVGLELMRSGREGSAKLRVYQSNEHLYGDRILPETGQKQNLEQVTVRAGP